MGSGCFCEPLPPPAVHEQRTSACAGLYCREDHPGAGSTPETRKTVPYEVPILNETGGETGNFTCRCRFPTKEELMRPRWTIGAREVQSYKPLDHGAEPVIYLKGCCKCTCPGYDSMQKGPPA